MATAIEPTTEEQLGFVLPDDANKLHMEYVPRDQVHPDPEQPRKLADGDLQASIRANGILQPITVRYAPEREGSCTHCGRFWDEIAGSAEYMIVFGERRWQGAGGILNDVPVIVRTDQVATTRRFLTQLMENHGRKNLSPIEDARGFKRALDEDPSLSQNKLAKLLDVAPSTLKDRLALLRNEAWIPLVETGEITSSQAVEVGRYADLGVAEHAAAIAYMRAFVQRVASDGYLGQGSTIADLEIATFRAEIGRAYGEPEEAPEPELFTAGVRGDIDDHSEISESTTARPNAGGGDEVIDDNARTTQRDISEVDQPESASETPASARDLPLLDVLDSGLRTSLSFAVLDQTLSQQSVETVQYWHKWVVDKLAGLMPTSAPFLGERLRHDEQVLADELHLRRQPVNRTTSEPANQVAPASEQLETVLTSAPGGASSSEAAATADVSAPEGRTETGLPDPAAPSYTSPATAARATTQSAPRQRSGGGLFTRLAPLVGKMPFMIMFGAGKGDTFRVTINPAKGSKLSSAVIVDGTPEELDTELADAIGGGSTKAAPVRVSEQAPAPAKPKESVKPKLRARSPRRRLERKKPGAKKAAPKKKATPAPKPKAEKPKKPAGLYPTKYLATLLNLKRAQMIKPEWAIKLARTAAKARGAITGGKVIVFNDEMKDLFGGKLLVALKDFDKMIAGQLGATQDGVDPAQIDITEEISSSPTT